jgi:hypothetical protein
VRNYVFGLLLMVAAGSCHATGIDFSSISCGKFVTNVSKTAHTDTSNVQLMMTWLLGYSAGRNGISTMDSGDAHHFFDELRKQCEADQTQLLLPLAERLGKTMLHKTLQ